MRPVHEAKRVEITIEAMMHKRLAEVLKKSGVSGYTVHPCMGGSGRSGEWSQEGQIGRASGLITVVCIMRPERVEEVLDGVFAVLEKHIGIVSISDCRVLRAERF